MNTRQAGRQRQVLPLPERNNDRRWDHDTFPLTGVWCVRRNVHVCLHNKRGRFCVCVCEGREGERIWRGGG